MNAEAQRLLIIGAGGHGKVVADAALAMQCFTQIAFVDDHLPIGSAVLGLPIVDAVAKLLTLRERFGNAAIAIGNAQHRHELFLRCKEAGFGLPNLIHPSAVVSRFAELGEGCVILAQAVIQPAAKLGDVCIVNTAASVDHDCALGVAVHVCPGARLAGNVSVGDRSWIGIGAAVRQGLVIGCDVMVAAGAVVVCDIPAKCMVLGVPARVRG